jgi:uncharacterized protein YcfJ
LIERRETPMRRTLLFALAALAGCTPTSTYRPTVDLAGADPARFEIDLHDCKKVAERDRYAPVLVWMLHGAILGTALGAVGGGYAGNIGLGESYGAIAGTTAGAVGGATQVHEPVDENQFVDQCLRNNGYKLGG